MIVKSTTSAYIGAVEKVINRETILKLQDIVRRVPASDYVIRYAVNMVNASRPVSPTAMDFVKRWVAWGAGPRASQYLVLGAKARAIMHGKYCADIEDIRFVAPSVLQHRIITNFNAEAEGIDSGQIVKMLLDSIGS